MDLNVPSSSPRRGGVVLWDGRLLRDLNGPKDLFDGLWWCDVSEDGGEAPQICRCVCTSSGLCSCFPDIRVSCLR